MRIDRVWAMPNKWTFQIQPIAKLLKEEMNGGTWLDPFCGKHSPAQITNDLNPDFKADYHMDALDLLKIQETNSVDGVLYDPPYSLRQVMECYKTIKIKPHESVYEGHIAACKKQISRVVKPGGKVICCGWNSNGIGKTRGFKMSRILFVPHGGQHNDTIVTVERKMNGSLF